MGLKKVFAKSMDGFLGHFLFVSFFATSGAYIALDDSDKLNDTVSPYRNEALEKIEPIFASIAASRNEIKDNAAQVDIDSIGSILNPHNGVITDMVSVNENLERKISKNAMGLAQYIINSKVLNEVDFNDLAERFNREGLSQYSKVNFKDVQSGTYRDECILGNKDLQVKKDQEVLSCMEELEDKNKGRSVLVGLVIFMFMPLCYIPQGIGESETLQKWRREDPPKKKLPRPDN